MRCREGDLQAGGCGEHCVGSERFSWQVDWWVYGVTWIPTKTPQTGHRAVHSERNG